ncbi:MAG: hypothetical protein JSW50_10840, partial [Candidatus Latescibacterota bacterium]
MKSKLYAIAVLCLALALAGLTGACSQDASDANEASASEVEIAQADAATGSEMDTAPTTPAGEAYQQLRVELMQIQRTATTQQKMAAALGQMEAKLRGFVEEFP